MSVSVLLTHLVTKAIPLSTCPSSNDHTDSLDINVHYWFVVCYGNINILHYIVNHTNMNETILIDYQIVV